VIADTPEDDAARDDLPLVGGDSLHSALGVGLESVARDLDRLHVGLAEDRDRGDTEAEPHRPRLSLRLP
jgi:hypothetical protein